MNPYQIGRSDESTPKEPSGPTEPDDELFRRQMRLVVRLVVLSVATTAASLILVLATGWSMFVVSIALALVLGLGFTIAWRI